MTGTGQVSIASNISAIAIASCSLASTSRAIAARIQATSAPAQNDGPSPASTTARSAAGSSRPRAAKAARSSAMSDASKALWRSGRLRVTRATTPAGPERSIRSPSPTRVMVRGRACRFRGLSWPAEPGSPTVPPLVPLIAQAEQVHGADRWLDERAADPLREVVRVRRIAVRDDAARTRRPPVEPRRSRHRVLGRPDERPDALDLASVGRADPAPIAEVPEQRSGVRVFRVDPGLEEVDRRTGPGGVAPGIVGPLESDGDPDRRSWLESSTAKASHGPQSPSVGAAIVTVRVRPPMSARAPVEVGAGTSGAPSVWTLGGSRPSARLERPDPGERTRDRAARATARRTVGSLNVFRFGFRAT